VRPPTTPKIKGAAPGLVFNKVPMRLEARASVDLAHGGIHFAVARAHRHTLIRGNDGLVSAPIILHLTGKRATDSGGHPEAGAQNGCEFRSG
jgi:hypothetical protein